jgi:hypothetical protein
MILMDYSGARGTLIHEKKMRSKISCQTPFKGIVQPQKKGVKRGTNRYALPSYTIADVFRYT